jgi:UDP-GlcNAc:undecaprenyl-phosphate GlcNAc-1-phosphate transferase
MASFLVLGVYRGIWRYTSLDDLIVFARAAIVGSVLSVLVLLFAFRFEGFSRTVFLIDGILMFMFLAGSRLAFRLFRQLVPVAKATSGRRVLIYGAGDGGELLLRELLNNRELKYSPVGFIDDDPAKSGKVIHGLKVFGGNGDLPKICQRHQIDEILISSLKMSPDRVQEIVGTCRANAIAVRRMRITIEDLLN